MTKTKTPIEAPPAVKLWINTTFRTYVWEKCNDPEILGMIIIGRNRGDSVDVILRNIVSAVVTEMAGMDLKEWE
jgi:hypothetical protein